MRTIKLNLLLIPLLVGCSSKQIEAKQSDGQNQLEYTMFTDIYLKWEDLFKPAKSQYFVYIYSEFCSHCAKIKEDVLGTIYDNVELFYLTEYSETIPITTNPSLSIGKEKVEEVAILGTPTLIEVSNHYVALNIAGEKDILEYLDELPHKTCR